MVFDLSMFTKPQTSGPIIATFIGEHGLGKTSLACEFPKPIMVRTEKAIKDPRLADLVDVSPQCTKFDSVMGFIDVLLNEEHEYKTLVVDTVTSLDTIIQKEVLETCPKGSSNIMEAHGGFGKALLIVANKHLELIRKCEQLSAKKNMHVIFLAHAGPAKVKPADRDEYFKVTLDMDKVSIGHYARYSDLVALLDRYTVVSKDEPKAKTGKAQLRLDKGTTRIIKCVHDVTHDAKNSLGITEPLEYDLGTNPFAPYLPNINLDQ